MANTKLVADGATSTPEANHLAVVYIGDAVAVGTVGPVCLAVWRGCVRLDDFERVWSVVERLRAKHGTVSALLVIEERSTPPDDATRKAMMDHLATFEGGGGLFAYAIEGQGFRASAARSALTSLRMSYRQAPPAAYAERVVELVPRVAKHLGRPADHLVTAVEELRAKLSQPG